MDGHTQILNSYDEAMIPADYDFPIKMMPLQALAGGMGEFQARIDVPTQLAQALVRTDTDQVLGVHGSKYKPITHTNVVNSIMDAVKKANVTSGYDVNVRVYEGGKKMKGLVKFPDIIVEPVVGDYTCLEIPFYNSYDASWAFSQTVQGKRLTCLNGQTIADYLAKTTHKHTLNIDVDGSARKITAGTEVFMNHREIWESWSRTSVTCEMAEQFFKTTIGKVFTNTTAFKYNNSTMESIMKIWNDNRFVLGDNKWALYNSMTYWSTHTSESLVPHNQSKRREVDVIKAMNTSTFKNLNLVSA
jgi:hypothetical protein|tara:strand:- start:819 stop:1724 length:906 start_codon:yes stop_codon:yes gene_type:complete